MARPDPTGSVVYFIGGKRGLVKIGVAKDVQARLRALQTGSAINLSILATAPGSYALERHYHRMFADIRERGEWFQRTPALVAEIKRLQKLDAPIYESAADLAEKERLRAEWASAVARRNRSASGEAA